VDLFYPMGPRLTMLLCTVYTQKGEEDFPIFDLLPDDDAYLIQEKAQAVGQLEGDKRAALVVREIRRQLQFSGLAGLEAIDPTWLLAGIKGEQPQTVGIILAQLSGGARSRILAQLPTEVREKVPTKEDLKNVKLEMMRIVRQQFEAKFVPMPAPPGEPTNFYFKDIGLLEARDLVQLVRALGIEQLASAFLTIGKRKLAELCSRLGKQASEELVNAFKEADPRDAMEMAEANDFLSRMVLGLRLEDGRNDTQEAQDRLQKELFQKAGLFRLAMAIREERPTFVQQLAQRIPRTHGRLLKNYVYRLGEGERPDPAKLRRLQDLLLFRVERLAERGKVNPRYLKFTFCYWGDDEQPAEEAPPEGEG
jgi:hypothetical protein